MIPPQYCPKTFTINILGLCRVYYIKKEVLELRRSIACLGGISNKDNVFRHGPCREVLESLLIFACIDPCGVTAYRKGACS